MPRRRRRRPARDAGPARVDDLLYPSLDLHGEAADAARRRAERWLRDQRQAGARTVRVITGWGKHSVGPAVLPGEIEGLLGELTGSVVSSFGREPGGGAYRIELLRSGARGAAGTRPAPPPASTLHSLDPELRRRAEEALAELGVTPTPELILAAIARLRAEEG